MFVHGMTSFRQSWDPVTDLLVQDFTCVRVDLRGHGASSAASEYSTVSLIGDVSAVVEELALWEAGISGHRAEPGPARQERRRSAELRRSRPLRHLRPLL